MKHTVMTLLVGAALLAVQLFAAPAMASCGYGATGCAAYQSTAQAPSGYTHVAQSYYSFESDHGNNNVIPPSVALRNALKHAPGSQGLGVRLVTGQRLMYAVKLKIGNQVQRILIDARTGGIVGQ